MHPQPALGWQPLIKSLSPSTLHAEYLLALDVTATLHPFMAVELAQTINVKPAAEFLGP
jgi:hypothetical protein